MTTETRTISRTDWLATKPAWAVAALFATYESDQSDTMTDYFNTRTDRRIFLAWSSHTRDLFAEMRKAAATCPETAHLGPGKDIYTAFIVCCEDIVTNGSAHWKGSASPWHRELYGGDDWRNHGRTFETRAEADAFVAEKGAPHDIHVDDVVHTFAWTIRKTSIEHREKYSMGAGYYLKASGRYSTGWTVEKTSWFDHLGDTIEVIARPHPTPPPTMTPTPDGVRIALNAARDGVELHFPSKPPDATREALKAAGWRWSRFSACWYTRDTPDARAFAATLTVDAMPGRR